jgi:hypothetical protein
MVEYYLSPAGENNQKNNLPMYGRLRRINSYNSLANLI